MKENEVGNTRKTVTARQRSVFFFSCCKHLASTIHFTFIVLEIRLLQQQPTINFMAFSILRWLCHKEKRAKIDDNILFNIESIDKRFQRIDRSGLEC